MNEPYNRRWSEQATLDDLYSCYRLLLGREPDKEGWKFWSQRLATEEFTFSKLAAYFRKSREYASSIKAQGIKLVPLDGFELYVQEYDWDIGENIIQAGQYEPAITAFLKQNLKEGMTFIDVGANIGYFTLLAATLVGSSGKTIAVECNARNCELIYMSLHRNGLSNVLVYPFAVSDSQKLMSFSWGFSNGFVSSLDENEREAVIVPAVTLDSLLPNEGRIDLIKMDIEGSEAKAWKGMKLLIEKHRPTILMEFFPALLKTISGVEGEEFLSQIFAVGYTASILQSGVEEAVPASTVTEVITAWKRQSEVVGDESKAYLDLALVAQPGS